MTALLPSSVSPMTELGWFPFINAGIPVPAMYGKYMLYMNKQQ
jgi:hypothetical protein